jgi:hypothetical protein
LIRIKNFAGIPSHSERGGKNEKMVIFVTVAILVVTGLISLDSKVFGQSAKKVLMIPREGYSSDLD